VREGPKTYAKLVDPERYTTGEEQRDGSKALPSKSGVFRQSLALSTFFFKERAWPDISRQSQLS
tara:strand:- start:622 stop:813 length:192 start_codon:yes stop_codon:yes gene_type:complete